MRAKALASAVATLVALAAPVMAQVDRTPNLATTVPGSWVTDRYEPQVFSLLPFFQGRNSVLQIGVNPTGEMDSRPSGFESAFYNTQGRQIGIDGVGTTSPLNQFLSLDLWLDPTWATAATGGLVRTDLWSRVNQVNDNAEGTAWYPIIGFTNQDGAGVARYWDSSLGWQTLATVLNYGGWNTFGIGFAENVFTAFVNGTALYSETADPGTTRLTTAFIEVYNFDADDPALGPNTNGGTYNAHWSNTLTETGVVPEPSSILLLGTALVGLAGVGAVRRRGRGRGPRNEE